MRPIYKDSTSHSEFFVLRRTDTGGAKTGLAFGDMTGSYTRARAARTAITMATLGSASAAFSSGGFVEVDATNEPGLYRFDIPDAAVATGVDNVVVCLNATGIYAEMKEFRLVNVNDQDPIRAGLTALPNAAAGATGGLDCTVTFGGTASAGAATTITLAGASATDNFYNHQHVRLLSGTGAGQERTIVAYNGTTKVATVGRNWTTNPDNTSVFSIVGPETMPSWNLFQGVASAGAASTVTLTGGSATSSIYNGSLVVIMAGTGARQARVCTAYNGGTGVVTVDRAWQTNPDSTSVIVILAADLPGADGAGNLLGSVASVVGAVGSVTGAVGSVTGAVGSVIGAVGSVTGNVGGSVASVTADVGITQTGADKVWGTAARTLTAFSFAVDISAAAVTLIWDKATSALTTAGSIGKLLVDNINATISSRSTMTTSQVKTQVTDALAVDTQAELSAVPSSTPTYSEILRWLYILARNKVTQTSTTQKVRNNADAADVGSSTVSDDGTTATRNKFS